MIVVPDTSIWIEFLRGRDPYLRGLSELLESNTIVGLSWIFGELLQGAKGKSEVRLILEFWANIQKVSEDGAWISAGAYWGEKKLFSKGIGLIDCAILMVTMSAKAQLWTLDTKLLQIAKMEKVDFRLMNA